MALIHVLMSRPDPLCILNWLCLLQFAGTLQLAALGPNLVIINAFIYSLSSLCVACMR